VDARADDGVRIVVRRLAPRDLERVIELDARTAGRSRRGYIEHKLEVSLLESSLDASLGAELDGSLVGFLLARVWTGEFGATEPAAVLDTIGVHPDFQGLGVGCALLHQLCTNLRGLGVRSLRTEADWEAQDLLRFFHREGFRPAPRLSLELDLSGARRRRLEDQTAREPRSALRS
jgi:ribosomal protein S18 acetylase RimI-like enzyme